MDDLEDIDIGTYAVTTETSQYLIDLQRRRLMRIPGRGLGPADPREPVTLLLAEIEGDNEWEPLLELLRCRVGEPLVALTDPGHDDSVVPRQSTRVRHIHRLQDDTVPAKDGPGAADLGYFDRDGDPIDRRTFIAHFGDEHYRFVRRDTVGDLAVVTAWLGIDQNPGESTQPWIFGTAAVTTSGQVYEDLEYFAANETEALLNHQRLLIRLLKTARTRTAGDHDGHQG